MASFSHTVTLAQPPEAVFPWLLEPEHVPRWMGNVEVYEPLDGAEPLRAGSRVRETLLVSGQRFAFELEITSYEPPHSAESRFSTNGVELHNTYAVVAADGGSRLTQSLDAKATSFGARMLIPVVQPRLERKLTEDLERLKALLEGAT
jgi:uncharacterized protein YndB with AHSA1/START domain